ncbi:F-box/kelch-repeat protein SKIP25 [Pyrus ussuriensis x Pyrus communis]|uniref:F-box/kelch-repeat protein SKIP25 n=1 Tax=Pyrus ussuriensis x Pyrus communis TaxID=2448454 RepID=A0A5N5I121_9ROSA|nr:F-box/kelch-repeat protein SKIP25 [Pyrus ussuriensis x Pyrus communis]
MVNVKRHAAKVGVVYDVEKDTWQDMLEGMIIGWRGLVVAMDEDVMYVVDEANGALRRYDPNKDVWEEIFESERLRGVDQIAVRGGRVCFVCGGEIFVVDVLAVTLRLWVVETPSGLISC